ncbi:MAG: HAD-IIA family hydrolase [Anaerolineaceae bacterium]|nr:HAD-IIA family hydrolase [Anaerolineaceae bacterium]
MILSLHPRICGMILDMDGVLWRGNQPVGDLPRVFARLQELNIRTIMATNNATRSIDQYLERMRGFGVELEPWQLINSAVAAAETLRRRFPLGGPVYIIGEDGLTQALQAANFSPAQDGALAVVAGLDRQFNYEKLALGADLIRSGVPFIGTNPDVTFPAAGGITPGAGAILAALHAASGVEPVIAGKPERPMYDLALQRLGTRSEETISVGDRLETDIAGGQRIGLRTALVLSGISTREQALAWRPQPDLIAENLTQLIE